MKSRISGVCDNDTRVAATEALYSSIEPMCRNPKYVALTPATPIAQVSREDTSIKVRRPDFFPTTWPDAISE